MNYRTFHCSRIGASHLRRGLPCQDASASGFYHGWRLAAVADGHGSRRHFRSEAGARFACETAFAAMRRLIDDPNRGMLSPEEQLDWLKRRICHTWRDAVLADCARHPWTETEIEEMRGLLSPDQMDRLLDGSDALKPYGTTLCLAFLNDDGWGTVQLGDGCMVHVSAEGAYDWPMPESVVNQGNRTASLCMEDPMMDFRHCWGADHPSALLLCTDGIEKSFPAQSAGIIGFFHWALKTAQADEAQQQQTLENMLDAFTRRSAVGDDVTVAGIVDADAPDAEPRLGRQQHTAELERLRARIQESANTVAFSMERLHQLADSPAAGDLRAQLSEIIARKRKDALALMENEARLAEQLAVEPLHLDEALAKALHPETGSDGQ